MTISLASLVPSVTYCVVTDPAMRESLLASGRRIAAEARASREFRRFGPGQPLWPDYVRVEVEPGFDLAVWRDPTRPELSSHRAAPVDAPDIDPEEAPVEGAPAETGDGLLGALLGAAARVAQTLYVQH